MRFALLGPLTVTDRFGGRVALPGPRQRVLLAALLVRAHDAWVQALAILDDLEHPEAERLRESIAAHPHRINLKIV